MVDPKAGDASDRRGGQDISTVVFAADAAFDDGRVDSLS